jgi:NNP family nitrate/nitrite transporter-like MFS transporter
MLLFLIVSVSLMWMHGAIRVMEKREHPELRQPKDLPEVEALRAEIERLRAAQGIPTLRPVKPAAAGLSGVPAE